MRLDQVQPKAATWLWPGRIPLGKLTLVDGDPGVGKSAVAVDVAARLTRGHAMPDGSRGDLNGPAHVLMLVGEDGLADTVRPRIEAAGGAPEFVHVRVDVPGPTFEDPYIEPTIAHLKVLTEDALTTGARLLIIDPLAEFLAGDTNTNSVTQVREALRPLRQLAEAMDIAVLAIRHLRKSANRRALYAGAGSISFVGAARSAFLCERDPSDETGRRRAFVQVKNNLAPEAASLAYRIGDGGVVEWLGPSTLTARDFEDNRPSAPARPRRREALDFILDQLEAGPRLAEEVRAAALAAGFSRRTIDRASQDHRIEKGPERFQGPSIWRRRDRQQTPEIATS